MWMTLWQVWRMWTLSGGLAHSVLACGEVRRRGRIQLANIELIFYNWMLPLTLPSLCARRVHILFCLFKEDQLNKSLSCFSIGQFTGWTFSNILILLTSLSSQRLSFYLLTYLYYVFLNNNAFSNLLLINIWLTEVMNIWKSYMWTAEWRIIWRKIITVVYATFAVAKRRPEKNSGLYGIRTLDPCDTG